MVESTVESSIEVAAAVTEKGPMRVLHVDDDAGFLKVARQCLEIQGPFKVEVASSVKEAVEEMTDKTFDVIVSDYQMPEKDGLEFLKELRDNGNDVPFIIFTGKGREEVAIKALNLGADRYISKGGDPETVYGELAHGIRQTFRRNRAEKMLRRSEEKYRNLFENAKDVIVLLDLKGNITSINKAAVEYGFRKDEVIGKNVRKFVPKRYWPKLLKELVQIARGKTVESRIEIITPKGKKGAEYRSDPMIVDDRVVGVQGVLRDITEHEKAEGKYKELAESISAVFFAMDKDLRYTFWNKASERLTGIRAKDAIGKSLTEVFVDVKGTEVERFYREVLRTKQHQTSVNEYRIGDKDFIFEIDAYPTENGLSVFVKDITEPKKMDEERNKHLHDYGERIKELRCLYEISKLVEKPGTSLDEMLQETTNLLLSAWQFPDITCSRIVFETQEFRTKNFKETRWRQCSDIEVNGKKVGSVEIYYLEEKPTIAEGPFLKEERDLIDAVAERLGKFVEGKRTQDALSRSEEKYKRIVELAPDSIITANAKGVVTSVNTTFTSLTGFSKDEIVGKHFTKVGTIQKRDLPMFLKIFTSLLRGKSPKPFEVMWKHKDGTIHPTEIHIALIKSNGKTIAFQAITRDITERRKAEEELKSSEDRLKVIFEFAPDAFYLNDLKGNFVDGNKAAEELTGYARSELTGKSFLKLKLLSRKQIMKAAKLLVKNALGKSTGPDEFVLNRKGGTQVSVEIRTFPVKIKDQTLVLGIARDISERKRTEAILKTMNEKLHVVGRLTRHDVRNKLSAVAGNVFLAKRNLAGNSEAQKYLGEIESACSQTVKILDFARTYEKLGIEELAYMDVKKSSGEAFSLFSDMQGVKVINDCRGLTVLADSLLRQLFYNLMDNSIKYGEKLTKIRVYFKKTGKDHLKLVFEDDGVGISKSEKEKIFREGYGKGTGYGLYLIRKICEVYGWTIRETGEQGKGAKFTMTIPKSGKSRRENYRLLYCHGEA
jgi:PAS domain S-box-containing protein